MAGRTGRFIRKDGTTKPSYDVLKKLVKDEWWTDMSVLTDDEGRAVIEGFKGDYQISADGRTASVSLTDDTLKHVNLSVTSE